MKRKASLFFAFTFVVSLMFPSCASPSDGVELWTVDGTQKIMQDGEYAWENASKSIRVSGAKNEYEGWQIILSSTGETASNYTVTASDLKTADGEVYDAENVSFFHQLYVELSPNEYYVDEGYYPDGIYTAMLEEMQKDIDRGLELGFNGARLHQKLFDPQFLYLCDKAGYMVWGEYASWGIDYSNLDGVGQFLKEWQEALKRDFNHPSIVVWCPLNEAWGDWNDARKKRDVRFVNIVYNFTKEFDSTRPCVDVSGGHHGKDTDLYDFHCYEPLPNLKKYLDAFENKNELDVPLLYCKGERRKYKKGLPVNLSECGGYSLSEHESNVDTVNEGAVQSEDAWGYGKGETDANAFVKRYEDLLSLISKYKKLSGFCYTQLYDIEQEQNGFYRYDRSDKLTIEQKRRIFNVNNLLD